MPGKKKKAEKKKKKKIEKITAQRKTFWGYPIFLLSVLLAGFAVHVSSIYPFSRFPFFYQKVLPYLGAALSVIALFTGHLSYPVVHNLRVYMAGYLTGMICFVIFSCLRGNSESSRLTTAGLFLCDLFNGIDKLSVYSPPAINSKVLPCP